MVPPSIALRKRTRRRKNRTTVVMTPPTRNGQGRARGKRRQRGGNSPTTAGNQRSFVVPIDEAITTTLTGTSGFTSYAYGINPGNPICFPFLSRTAQNYERYEFEHLKFEYRPSASVFATVGAQGFVTIAATMDATQQSPSTQGQVEIMAHSPVVETAKPTSLTLNKAFLQSVSPRQMFFVRGDGYIPPGTDPHLYDCGQVFVGVTGQANSNAIGEFRVTGKVRLVNPILDQSAYAPPNFQTHLVYQPSSACPASGNPLTIPWSSSSMLCPGITNTSGTLTLPVGNWIIDADVSIIDNTVGASCGCTTAFLMNGVTPVGTIYNGGGAGVAGVPSGPSTHVTWATGSAGGTTVSCFITPVYTSGAPTYLATLRIVAV